MTDSDKAEDIYRYYSYCRMNGHDEYLKKAELALDFYVGKQWSQQELTDMAGSGRPALTINQMFRTLDSLVGEMIYSTGDVRNTPSSDSASDEIADVMDKIYMNVHQQNQIQYYEPQVILSGLLTGRGYWDVRVDFDENMQGNICVNPLRSQNVVLDPEVSAYDPDKWSQVFTTGMYSNDQIKLMYGDAAAKELGATPQANWLSPYDLYGERLLSQRMYGLNYDQLNADPNLLKMRRLIERQYKVLKYKDFFIDPQTGDMSEVPETWDRNRIAQVRQTTGVEVIKRRAETLRWTVTCDRYVLHDEDSPYKHFTVVPYFPYFTDGYTLGLGENLIDMQRMTNKLYSQVLHILNSAANSGWKVKQGSLKNMTEEELEAKGAQTGLTVVLDNVDDLERIEPGQLPSGHDHLAQTLRGMFNEIAGYTQTMAGQDRPEQSGKAIESKIARGAVNLATAYNTLYHTKTLLAGRINDLAQTFYTETRLLRITQGLTGGTQGFTINQPTPEGEVLNDITVGKYSVTIIPTPARETVEQNTFQQLVEMRRDLGVVIPDEVLIQYSALPQKSKVMEAIKEAGGTPEAQQAAAQLAQQMQEAELADKQASARNSDAQAKLALSRAGKAQVDAQVDPNARNQLDAARIQTEQQRDNAQLAETQRQHSVDTALDLTKETLSHTQQMAKIQADREKTASDAATKKAVAKAKPKPKAATPRKK